jgi:hypothetical protein
LAYGEVRFLGAELGSQLTAKGGRFKGDSRPAFSADRSSIAGDVYLDDGFAAEGTVRLVGVKVGGQLGLVGARLTAAGPHVEALLLNELHVHGDAYVAPKELIGDLYANGSRFDSLLVLAVGRGRHASKRTGAESAKAVVDFSGASIERLDERYTDWSGVRPATAGVRYQSIIVDQARGATWLKTRLRDWLARTHGFLPRAAGGSDYAPAFDVESYRALVGALGRQGLADFATDTAVAREGARRRAGHVGPSGHTRLGALSKSVANSFHWLYGVTSGFGLKTLRPLALLLALICVGVGAYLVAAPSAFQPAKSGPGAEREAEASAPFDPDDGFIFALVYSVDVSLPIIDLHEESAWRPNGPGWGAVASHVLVMQIVLGWFFTTLLAISLGKRIAREPD